MTQKARNKVSAKAGSNHLLNPEPTERSPLTAKHIDKETTPTILGLKIESPEQLVYAKEHLENVLTDWALFSQKLIGPSATKALLYDMAKAIHVKGGRPKKPFNLDSFVETLESHNKKSTKAVTAEGVAKHMIPRTRKARQRADDEATKLGINMVNRLRSAAIELGYITNEAGLSELGDILLDEAKGAAVFERVSQGQDK